MLISCKEVDGKTHVEQEKVKLFFSVPDRCSLAVEDIFGFDLFLLKDFR